LDIEQGFNRLINTQQLRVDLRKSLIQQLDTHSEQFDASHFKTLLNHSLERLTLPSLQLETGDMTQMISQHFQGEITEQQQMDALRDTLNRALHQVFSHLAARFRTASETLYRQLDDLSHDLGQQLTADIHQELEKLRHDFADQQARVRQYQELMEYIRRSAQKQD
jgi:DNA anti-recombination protein RmuC